MPTTFLDTPRISNNSMQYCVQNTWDPPWGFTAVSTEIDLNCDDVFVANFACVEFSEALHTRECSRTFWNFKGYSRTTPYMKSIYYHLSGYFRIQYETSLEFSGTFQNIRERSWIFSNIISEHSRTILKIARTRAPFIHLRRTAPLWIQDNV